MSRKIVAYMDGFNLYHSINQYLGSEYLWVDYRKIVEQYLSTNDMLMDIFLFTAEPKWNTIELQKHRIFMDITSKHKNIRVINGNYSSVTRTFHGEKMTVVDRFTEQKLNIQVHPTIFSYHTYEEKQTDVNIALYILEGAFKDYYDKALIFSGDSDIAPAILMAQQHFPDKQFTGVLPLNGKGHVISRACHKTKKLNEKLIKECKMSDIMYVEGKTYINPYKTNAPFAGDIQG